MSELSNNIVSFPGVISRAPDPIRDSKDMTTFEESTELVSAVKYLHVGETHSLVIKSLMQQLFVAGFSFDPKDREFYKDIIIMTESVKSLMLKYHEMPHPIQKISAEVITRNEDGTYRIKEE